MATPLALVWDLIATDNASAVFKKVGAEAGAASKETAGLGGTFSKIGGIVALAGAALTVVAVKMAMDMQETTAKIQGNAQITQKAAVGIGDAFLATAGKSTFSGKSMAEAFAPVAGVIQSLSGKTLTAADSMKVMNAATMLAEASGKPLSATTANLAAVMQNYGLKVKDAAEVSNTLFNASRLTNIDLDTLTATVDKLHGKLGIASPTLADTSSLLVDLANHGISGSKGVLVVNGALTNLLGGSKGTTAELKTLGVHVFDASGKFVGMKGVLEQLTPKLKDMTEQQRLAAEKALFGAGAGRAMNATIMAGSDALGTATVAVTKHNAAEDAAKAASETLGGQLKTLKAAFADIMVIVGEKVIPVITSAVKWFKEHEGVTKVLAAAVGGILVVAIGAYTIAMVQAAVATIAATWPILLIIAAVGLLAAGIYLVATKTTWFQTAWTVMTDALSAAWRWMWNSVLAPIIRFVLNGFASIVDGIANMLSVLSNIPGFGWAKDAADKMKGAANQAHALAQGIKDIPNHKDITITIGAKLAGALASTYASQVPKFTVPGHNALGTDNWSGGSTWVGERGPEIVNLPKGSQVIPNNKTGGSGRMPTADEIGYAVAKAMTSAAGSIQHVSRNRPAW